MINATIKQYIAELRGNPEVPGVLLFGSWARSNNRDDIDVDLIVIVKHGFRRIVVERANKADDLISGFLGCEKGLRTHAHFLSHAVKQG